MKVGGEPEDSHDRATSAASSFALWTFSPSYQYRAARVWPDTATELDQAVRPPRRRRKREHPIVSEMNGTTRFWSQKSVKNKQKLHSLMPRHLMRTQAKSIPIPSRRYCNHRHPPPAREGYRGEGGFTREGKETEQGKRKGLVHTSAFGKNIVDGGLYFGFPAVLFGGLFSAYGIEGHSSLKGLQRSGAYLEVASAN